MTTVEYPRTSSFGSTRTIITVHENSRILLPLEFNNAAFRELLMTVASRFSFEVLIRDRLGLRAGSVVGIWDVGDLTIQILPKTANINSTKASADFLLNILHFSDSLPRVAMTRSGLDQSTGPLLDPIIAAFASDISCLIAKGIPRRYEYREERSPVIRGRLDFIAMSRAGFGQDHFPPIRHAPLQWDNPLSRLVLAVTLELAALSHSETTRSVLNSCVCRLAGVSVVPLSQGLVDNLVLSRYESSWASVLELAKVLVRGNVPSIAAPGNIRSAGLIFPLELLFEKAIAKSLNQALRSSMLRVKSDRRRLKLLKAVETQRDVLTLKPDFVFSDTSKATPVLVGDAKWKALKARGATHGLKAGDIYQLAIYMTRHGVDRGILFFPRTEWMDSERKCWVSKFKINGASGSRIVVAGVDIESLVSSNKHRRAVALEALRSTIQMAAGFSIE